MATIYLKRIYDAPAADDGWRVLVDRLWPRDISKEKASVDYWAKDIAPSAALRAWFAHDAEKWLEFKARYKQELAQGSAWKNLCGELTTHEVVTLLFAARNVEHNNAMALKEFLQAQDS